MEMILVTLAILASVWQADAIAQLILPTPIPEWSYADTVIWKNTWPACGWGQQSPIDIPVDTIQVCLDPLHIENLYWPQSNLILQNDYTGAALWLETQNYPILISGGPLPKGIWFYAIDLYFHVGVDDSTGSDHTLQGVPYPIEIKLELQSEEVNNATSDAVLSFFVAVSSDDNDAWEPIIQGLSRIKQGGSVTTVSFANLAALLPAYSTWETKYYSYLGSSSSPPCDAKVIRVVYSTFIRLSERQIHAFRLLQDANGRPLTDNIRRPIPTLDYRAVLKY